MITVVMPTLGLTMGEGTLVRWLKAEGEAVQKGESLFEVQNEKATVEVECPVTGWLRRVLVREGETVPVSTPIAEIAAAEDAAARAVPGVPSGVTAATTTQPTGVQAQAALTHRPGHATGTSRERVVATPRARKAALARGVALAGLRGTGPNGRITENDVLAAAGAAVVRRTTLAAEPENVVALSPMRRVVADRMAKSDREVARVTLFSDVDATELVRVREQLAVEFERRRVRLRYDALIARACAIALDDFPTINAQWVEGVGLRRHARANIGVAVALDPEGLVVPVLRDAGSKGLPALVQELHHLVEKARAGRLLPDEMTGGTFTVTNLGATGIRAFTPIVNAPETAILGIGAIHTVAAFVGEHIERRAEMTLSLSFDHRVVDGLPAGRFLARIRDLLERPYALVMDLQSPDRSESMS